MDLYAQVILSFDFMNSISNEHGSSAAAASLDHTICMSSNLAMSLEQCRNPNTKDKECLQIIHSCIRTSQFQRSIPNTPYKTSGHMSRQAQSFDLACTQQVGVMSLKASSFAGLECQELHQSPHKVSLAVINLSPWDIDDENAENHQENLKRLEREI